MEGGQLLQTRIGGVPLVVIVGLGAGAIAILMALRARAGATNKSSQGVDMLSPSSAEAFGTLQQQQADLGNALSAISGQVNDVGGSVMAGRGELAGYGNTIYNQVTGARQDIYWARVKQGATPAELYSNGVGAGLPLPNPNQGAATTTVPSGTTQVVEL